nr:hypothetical protein [Hassalia byssoidea]
MGHGALGMGQWAMGIGNKKKLDVFHKETMGNCLMGNGQLFNGQ